MTSIFQTANIIFVFLVLFANTLFSKNIVTIIFTKGSVFTLKKDTLEWVPSKTGNILKIGDRVRTDGNGRAVLRIDDFVLVKIRPLSICEPLPQKSGISRLKLYFGRVYVATIPEKRREFQLETTQTIAGVRGTSFAYSEPTIESITTILKNGRLIVDTKNPRLGVMSGMVLLSEGLNMTQDPMTRPKNITLTKGDSGEMNLKSHKIKVSSFSIPRLQAVIKKEFSHFENSLNVKVKKLQQAGRKINQSISVEIAGYDSRLQKLDQNSTGLSTIVAEINYKSGLSRLIKVTRELKTLNRFETIFGNVLPELTSELKDRERDILLAGKHQRKALAKVLALPESAIIEALEKTGQTEKNKVRPNTDPVQKNNSIKPHIPPSSEKINKSMNRIRQDMNRTMKDTSLNPDISLPENQTDEDGDDVHDNSDAPITEDEDDDLDPEEGADTYMGEF